MKTLILKILDLILSPLTFLFAKFFRFIRLKGVTRMTISRAIFRKVGVFPVTNHYYDPMPDFKNLNLIDKPMPHPTIKIDYDRIFTFSENLSYKSETENINMISY